MKKKTGFTLIELLSVIVILSIIAFITIPLILNVIETSKKGAFRDSVLHVFDATNYYMLEHGLSSVPENGILVKELQLKPNHFSSGVVLENEDGILYVENVSQNKYCANGTEQNLIITKEDCKGIMPEITLETDAIETWIGTSYVLEEHYQTGKRNIKKETLVNGKIINNLNELEAGDYIIEYVVTNPYGLVNKKEQRVRIHDKERYDKYETWVYSSGNSSFGYESYEAIKEKQELIEQLKKSEEALEYMYQSTGIISKKIVEEKDFISSLITTEKEIKKIASLPIWVEQLKGSSIYDELVPTLLNSSYLTNEEKYQATLPTYIFNNGTTYQFQPIKYTYYVPFENRGCARSHQFTVGNPNIIQQIQSCPSDCAENIGGPEVGIDVTKYNKIGINVVSIQQPNPQFNAYLLLSTRKASSITNNNLDASNVLLTLLKTGKNYLDVSDKTGTLYPVLRSYSCTTNFSSSNFIVTVNQWWIQ